METAYLGSHEISSTRVDSAVKVKNILSALYIFIPIAAGLDKFFNILTDWTQYLNPLIRVIFGISAGLFMNIVGVVEIAAGVIVFLNRRIGAFIVSAWLLAIALQLILNWMYVDVAVRDLALSAGAFCLALLSERKESH